MYLNLREWRFQQRGESCRDMAMRRVFICKWPLIPSNVEKYKGYLMAIDLERFFFLNTIILLYFGLWKKSILVQWRNVFGRHLGNESWVLLIFMGRETFPFDYCSAGSEANWSVLVFLKKIYSLCGWRASGRQELSQSSPAPKRMSSI